MKLNRSFFSLYFLVISTFIIFSWLLDEVWSSYLEQDIESYTGYKVMLTAVGDYIKKHPREEWPDIVEGAGKRYGLSLSLISIAEFDDSEHFGKSVLIKDDTHVYYGNDSVTIHHLLEDDKTVLTLGPAKMPTRPRIESLIRVIILASFGVIIFIWLWPVSTDLDRLKKAAGDFGNGNFDTKAPLAKSSMMASMVTSFNMMASRIKRLIEAHKELTSAVSHELRTPLARSKFALQMLENTKDDEKRSKYIKQITGDICELEELINEMLLYAAFDSDKPELNFSLCDVNALVQQQVNSHSEYQGKIEFINKTPHLIAECDSHFIDRAINNFITNAFKYGGGKVLITTKVKDGYCIICIEDNGDGVSDDFKKVIFDAFSRGDQSRNRETGGFGLGLAIVARIMEWHLGQASINDSELGGAAFSLRWPLKRN